MANSSIMSTLVRRSLRLSRASPPTTATRQLFHSSSSPVLTKLSKPASNSLLNSFRFASSSSAVKLRLPADEKLSRVIDSEILCGEELLNDDVDQLTMGMPIAISLSEPVSKGGLVPDGFPFEIIDTPGEETITLKRQYEDETIEVLVHPPQMNNEEKEDEDDKEDEEDDKEDEEDDKDEDKEDETCDDFEMPLTVTVTKGNGSSLEFTCSATRTEIAIDNLVMKSPQVSDGDLAYHGPDFMDLDPKLQREFFKYLERRGIKSSYTNFLQEYMVNKDNKEYVKWLKNMKEFVQK